MRGGGRRSVVGRRGGGRFRRIASIPCRPTESRSGPTRGSAVRKAMSHRRHQGRVRGRPRRRALGPKSDMGRHPVPWTLPGGAGDAATTDERRRSRCAERLPKARPARMRMSEGGSRAKQFTVENSSDAPGVVRHAPWSRECAGGVPVPAECSRALVRRELGRSLAWRGRRGRTPESAGLSVRLLAGERDIEETQALAVAVHEESRHRGGRFDAGHARVRGPDGSRNLWWCSLLSWGGGRNNNYLANPRAWSYRERWWERDPGAAVVWVILGMPRRTRVDARDTRVPIRVRCRSWRATCCRVPDRMRVEAE